MSATLTIDVTKFNRTDSVAESVNTTMDGVITRSGKFKYDDGIRIKDWGNLVEVFKGVDYLPVYGSVRPDSHKEREERLIGFAHDFRPDHEKELMYADVEFLDDIKNLSELEDPKDLPVSIAFKDLTPVGAGTSNIAKVHHLAVSLNANEIDRCSSMGGHACTISKKTVSERSSSSSNRGDLVKLKKKRDDSIMTKPNEKEITERQDAEAILKSQKKIIEKPAAPDNIGSETHNKKLVDESAKKAFILDCQKNSGFPDSNCEAAWLALNTTPNSPQKKDKKKATESPLDLKKTSNKDFENQITQDMKEMKSVISQLADFLPTLSDVVAEKQNAKAVEVVDMRNELKDAGFCGDMLDKMTDYEDMNKFFKMAKTNKSLFIEPDPDEVAASNTTRLLGKRQRMDMETKYEDLMEKAKADALVRLKKPALKIGA